MRHSPRGLRLLTILVVCMTWAMAVAQQRIVNDTLYAHSTGQRHPVVLLLPEGYDPKVRYPILYLLHGYGGGCRDWTERTGIEEFLSSWPLIVVMPDAGNSWYVDSPVDSSAQYESYIVRDVRSYVESRYGVDSSRRSIAGLSMGGYGALMLAMRHPDLFRFAGSLSGAIVVPGSLRRSDDVPSRPAIRATQKAVFGEPTEEVLARYDLSRLSNTLTPKTAPYLYFVTGIQDGLVEFLPAQRALTDQLRASHLPYEYHETPGGHSWTFWDREIRPLLLRMREVLDY
jgi:S-formylglutathione hydrolase FrmB